VLWKEGKHFEMSQDVVLSEVVLRIGNRQDFALAIFLAVVSFPTLSYATRKVIRQFTVLR